MDDPTASAERTALLAGTTFLMVLVLVLFLFVVGLYLSLKTERDVNDILKAKIVGRLIQCP
jgi:hypothetical protein